MTSSKTSKGNKAVAAKVTSAKGHGVPIKGKFPANNIPRTTGSNPFGKGARPPAKAATAPSKAKPSQAVRARVKGAKVSPPAARNKGYKQSSKGK